MKTYQNILLVSPALNYFVERDIYPTSALMLIGTMLYNQGCNVKIVHLVADRVGPFEFRDIVSSFKPDIVGISMTTLQAKSARELSKIVKTVNSNILVVVGGPHPSALKLKIFDDFPHVDVVVVGEGEHTFLEIVEGKDLSEIKGICYQGKMNPLRPLAENLDYIPLPNLDLIDLNRFACAGPDYPAASPAMFIMGSRGCPFHCTFCTHSVFGDTARLRKPESIIAEIRWLHERYGIREIDLMDDTFNLNKERAKEIFNLIIDNGLNKGIIYRAQFRANEKMVDRELLQLAKNAGVWIIYYGVESGSQEMLDKMRKRETIKEIKRAFDLTHKVGLKTLAHFIIGMPSETRETIMDSINLWRELKPYNQAFHHAAPYPDTEFERAVIEKNHLLVSSYDEYNPHRIMARTDSLTEDDLEHYARLIDSIISMRHTMERPRNVLGIIIDAFRNPKSVIRRGEILWNIMLFTGFARSLLDSLTWLRKGLSGGAGNTRYRDKK